MELNTRFLDFSQQWNKQNASQKFHLFPETIWIRKFHSVFVLIDLMLSKASRHILLSAKHDALHLLFVDYLFYLQTTLPLDEILSNKNLDGDKLVVFFSVL